jgi:hypothetical protein
MVAEIGYQMPASSVEHLLTVVIFSLFHIVIRDVPHYDYRRVVSNATRATKSSPSVSPPGVLHSAPTISASLHVAWLATSSAEHLLNVTICSTCKLMRWLFALLCFIDTEKIIDTVEDALRTLNPGKIIGSEKIIDTGEKIIDTDEGAVRTWNPDKIIDTEKIIDTGEDAVRTWNPDKIIDTEKIIDTGEDADPRLNPGKVIDTEKIIDTGEDAEPRLNPGKPEHLRRNNPTHVAQVTGHVHGPAWSRDSTTLGGVLLRLIPTIRVCNHRVCV